VQWLVERDGDGRLRYASLQSQAPAAALIAAGIDDPGTLPDSIVLVDAAGVHVRYSAILRIGATLGFPYSLGKVALIVPRPLRDAVYKTIARNRYRWFGRREVCMRPTPELKSRFLDADEPAIEVPADAGPVDEPDTTAMGWAKSWLVRLVVVYVLLYMLSFPFFAARVFGRTSGPRGEFGIPDLRWSGRVDRRLPPRLAADVSARGALGRDRGYRWINEFPFNR
jgi:predicted DCC family thiol-disulfide oxidoreductase YuxK